MALTLTAKQQAVVKRFSLDIGTVNGNYRVEDSFIGKFYIGDPSKNGIYIKRKLDDAIQAAVDFRAEHDAEMSRRSGFSTGPVKVTPPPPPVVAPKPRVMIDDSPVDDIELELDDVELDNTGQRLKKHREPPKRKQCESRYLRATRVLVKRPHIGIEPLAKQAVLATSTAFWCQVAFYDILNILDAEHCLNAAGKRLLEKTPKPKKGHFE